MMGRPVRNAPWQPHDLRQYKKTVHSYDITRAGSNLFCVEICSSRVSAVLPRTDWARRSHQLVSAPDPNMVYERVYTLCDNISSYWSGNENTIYEPCRQKNIFWLSGTNNSQTAERVCYQYLVHTTSGYFFLVAIHSCEKRTGFF